MDSRTYLSVLQAPTASGDISVVLSTYGASSDITLTMSATGLFTTDSEEKIAKKLYDQFLVQLAQAGAIYTSPAESITVPPPATIQITRTDHVICFWSQASLNIEISSNNPNSILAIRNTPTLMTVPAARSMSVVLGQDFSNLSNAQLAELLNAISDEIISVACNNFVSSTYLLSVWINDVNGYRLPHFPVQKIDRPLTADPWTIWSISSYKAVDLTNRYLIQKDGWVMYRDAQKIVHDDINPFAYGNEFRITWIAGESKIPQAVKVAIIKLATFYTNYSIYEELKGGTSSVKFKDEEREKKMIMLTLSGFFR